MMENNTEVAEISAEEQTHNDAIAANANQTVDDGLPSDVAAEDVVKANMFHGMSDEWKEANLKDGKLLGKFDNIDDLAKSYNKLNNERAENGQKAKDTATEAETAANTLDVTNNQLGEIAQNGFDISEDNYKAFEEAGISRDKAENMAYKMEKAANKAYDMVGSKAEYESLMTWAGENLDQEQINGFASRVVGSNFSILDGADIMIEGLKSMRAKGGNQTAGRVSGNTTPQQTMQGWKNKAEYNADLKAMNRDPNNQNNQRAYDAKMKLTNMNTLR